MFCSSSRGDGHLRRIRRTLSGLEGSEWSWGRTLSRRGLSNTANEEWAGATGQTVNSMERLIGTRRSKGAKRVEIFAKEIRNLGLLYPRVALTDHRPFANLGGDIVISGGRGGGTSAGSGA